MPGQFYKHAAVRDLAWAGFSPLLIKTRRMSGAGLRFGRFWRSHLQQLDRDPAPLLEHLQQSGSQRLGLYYESLWHYLLQTDPSTDLLAHNLPVRDGQQTVGEFDCLFYCQRRSVHLHLELAVKFYLGIATTNTWLGPGRHDSLDRKLEHLQHQQSKLAQHPAARAPLQALGITHCKSLVDIKGYLFSPAQDMAPPPGHNPDNPMQRWYHVTEFRKLAALPNDWVGWQKIPRKRWLSPYLANEVKPLQHQDLLALLADRFEHHQRPLQLAACDASGAERKRCFVTPDGWFGF